ncbi:MAG: hypothetical protein FD163_1653 [Hyphomonadaceae bacterium]|nr:MAG: hypothetical protein FD128_1105 [Hyphomonadaceae bacterium]KAF0184956.1 MAG: hypothetical protein FD163_1653 [Hyphomonadaceae bacterium]
MKIENQAGKPLFEKILEVTNFYDRPRCGVTEFQGRKCYFEFTWDHEADDYSPVSILRPIPNEIYEAIASVSSIWSVALALWRKTGQTDTYAVEIPRGFKLKFDMQKKIIKQWVNGEKLEAFCSVAHMGSWKKYNDFPERWGNQYCDNLNSLDDGVFWDIVNHYEIVREGIYTQE